MYLKISKMPVKIVTLSDTHIPFHDPVAIRLAIKLIGLIKPKIVIFNGDIIDHHGIRKFPTIPRHKTLFSLEVDISSQFINKFIKELEKRGVEEFYWIEGNHENRLKKFLMQKAEELYDIDQLSIPNLYQLQDNVTYLERHYKPCPIENYVAPGIKAGPLHITHGDLFKSNHNLINVARTLYLKLQVPMLIGHWHRNDRYLHTSYEGKISGFWVQGCLCLQRPEYDAGKVWGQGISVIDVLSDKLFSVEIIDFIRSHDNKLVGIWKGNKIEENIRYKNDDIIEKIWTSKNLNNGKISKWVNMQFC